MLAGQVDQYHYMYENYIGVAKERLFFRPMNPDNLDILLAGSAEKVDNGVIRFKPEGQHLTCFIGGMMALSSKVFERKDDLDVAKKLVDGCVWAYSTTQTGIMPEVFTAIPPPDGNPKNKWEESRWLDFITKMHPAGSPDEVKDAEERAKKIASSLRIPKGMAGIQDRRYILRSVFITT